MNIINVFDFRLVVSLIWPPRDCRQRLRKKIKKKEDTFNDISKTRETYHTYDVPQRVKTSHKNK